jgi:radical SAM superfamily enzyme YgiQ (UPF0313 family)
MQVTNNANIKIALVSPHAAGAKVRLGENLGIRYIGSYLKSAGYICHILESDFLEINVYDLAERLADYDLVGFSINFSLQFLGVIEILEAYESFRHHGKTNTIFIAGGHWATFCYEKILREAPNIKAVVLGEGEQPVLNIVSVGRENLHLVDGVAFGSVKSFSLFCFWQRLSEVRLPLQLRVSGSVPVL